LDRPGGDWGWADTLHTLIERGHRLSDIRGYTFAQLRAFTHAAGRARRRALRDAALSARAAQWERADWAAFVRALETP